MAWSITPITFREYDECCSADGEARPLPRKLIIGTLASLYPAVRASRLDPAEAMKFEQ